MKDSDLRGIDPTHESTRPAVPSQGVVASNGQGKGCVLWWTDGSNLDAEIRECSSDLAELGLDDAPRGLSIWEGSYRWVPGPWDCPSDGHTEPIGKFRPPTADEWTAIMAGTSPFPEPPEAEEAAS